MGSQYDEPAESRRHIAFPRREPHREFVMEGADNVALPGMGILLAAAQAVRRPGPWREIATRLEQPISRFRPKQKRRVVPSPPNSFGRQSSH